MYNLYTILFFVPFEESAGISIPVLSGL